jgi:hypothetical protein
MTSNLRDQSLSTTSRRVFSLFYFHLRYVALQLLIHYLLCLVFKYRYVHALAGVSLKLKFGNKSSLWFSRMIENDRVVTPIK